MPFAARTSSRIEPPVATRYPILWNKSRSSNHPAPASANRSPHPRRLRQIGFQHGPCEPMEFQRETSDSGTPATIDLVGPGHPADRRRQFAASLERLSATPGRKVVTCVPAPGHEHDITVALPSLTADRSVLATFVVAAYTPPEPATVPQALPEGSDASISFDPARVKARHRPRRPRRACRLRRHRARFRATRPEHVQRPKRRPTGPGARALPHTLIPTLRTVLRITSSRHPDRGTPRHRRGPSRPMDPPDHAAVFCFDEKPRSKLWTGRSRRSQ